MGKIRFAIIGAGVIGPMHAKVITDNPRAELVAVCDIIPERAKALGDKYGVPYYEDYHEVLALADVDVVNICVPSGIHGEIAVAAAEAGKHVLCEKPLEITREKMDEMIAACDKAGVKLGCVFQRRAVALSQGVKRVIEEGHLGKLVLGDAYLKYYRDQKYYDSAGWRGTWELDGGGALMNQGVHGIDLIQWLMGDVESVYARAGALVRDIEVEDTAVISVRYKNGALGVIQGTTSVYPGYDTRFEIHGEKGSIIFGDQGIVSWEFLDADVPRPQESESVGGSSDPASIASLGHYLIVDDMISAILENREPMINGREARRSVDLILAIYESARTNREVIVGEV